MIEIVNHIIWNLWRFTGHGCGLQPVDILQDYLSLFLTPQANMAVQMIVPSLGSFHANVLRLLWSWVICQMFFASSAFDLAPFCDLDGTFGNTRRKQKQAWKYQAPGSQHGPWQAMMDVLRYESKGESHCVCFEIMWKQTRMTSSWTTRTGSSSDMCAHDEHYGK